jgi:hypothetical protein
MAESIVKFLRFSETFGRRGRIPLGHSAAYENYIFRPGGDDFIPGTKIPRLRRVALGERAIGFVESEVDALIEALAAQRDVAFSKRDVTSPPRPRRRSPRATAEA